MSEELAPIDDGHLDLSNHDSFWRGVPHKTFDRLRAEDPVHWTPEHDGGRGFWSITRHADIAMANKENQIFSSAQGIRIEDQTYEEYLASSRISGIVSDALKSRQFDAVDAIAKRLPMMMLGRILGVPDSDLDWLVEKGDALIGNTDPDFTDTVVDQMDTDAYRFMPFRSPAGVELYDYAQAVIDGEKAVDANGVLRRVLDNPDLDNRMSAADFKNFFCLLVAAGNDTTRYSIAMALYMLTQQKELLAQLQGGEVWNSAPDEFIRYASPTLHFRRTLTQDFELGGKTLRQGDKAILWFVSGNRDSAVFDDPHRVRLDRSPNHHLSFGQGGVHVCLGMWLARLEVRIVLEELANRLTDLSAVNAPRWTRSNFICGVKELNVTATLR